jgi:hypothetical protein
MTTADPVAVWHECVARNDLGAFEALVAEDAVFESPAVHTPLAGKALAVRYLRAALRVLNNGSFRYTGEWREPRSAVLEFEARLDGLTVNGVDMVRWNDAGLVTHFKVMVRPFKALTALMAAMKSALESASD